MGFYSDWLNNAEQVLLLAAQHQQKIIDSPWVGSAQNELQALATTVRDLQAAKIIKIPEAQLNEFITIPHNQDQDFNLLRSPFESLFMDVVPPLVYKKYYDEIEQRIYPEVKVHGVMLSEHTLTSGGVQYHSYVSGETIDMFDQNIKRFWNVTMFVPMPGAWENTFTTLFGLTDDNRLVRTRFTTKMPMHAMTNAMHERFIEMAVHIMNYLTSPSLVLELKHVDAALQAARKKRGKQPLPDWYEITYRKTKYVNVGPHAPGSHHSFRYDVRGHFKHMKVGKLAGRVLWCPAHQRGLANEIYKPKIYNVAFQKQKET